MRVLVCTWDPAHTLSRAEVQRRAVRNGAVAGLVKRHGEGTEALRAAFLRYKLASSRDGLDGSKLCAVCGALMDEVLSRDGIDDRVEAIRDVALDFDKAVDRTRKARLEEA